VIRSPVLPVQNAGYLQLLCEMFLFHAYILLMRAKADAGVRSCFNKLLRANELPKAFCMELMFKYLMYEECLTFLVAKGEFSDALRTIRTEYQKAAADPADSGAQEADLERKKALREYWL